MSGEELTLLLTENGASNWWPALLQTHCVSRVVAAQACAHTAEDALVADEIRQGAEHVAAHIALVDQAALLAQQTTHLQRVQNSIRMHFVWEKGISPFFATLENMKKYIT